jgi:hypothetical protein
MDVNKLFEGSEESTAKSVPAVAFVDGDDVCIKFSRKDLLTYIRESKSGKPGFTLSADPFDLELAMGERKRTFKARPAGMWVSLR